MIELLFLTYLFYVQYLISNLLIYKNFSVLQRIAFAKKTNPVTNVNNIPGERSINNNKETKNTTGENKNNIIISLFYLCMSTIIISKYIYIYIRQTTGLIK